MLQNLINKILKKGPAKEEGPEVSSSSTVQTNWNNDRYENLLTQRNFLLLVSIFSFVGIIVSVLAVGQISISKSFAPFVIQIEEKTGAAKIVNTASSDLLSGNDALSRYFIKKFLIARETYNPVDFDSNVRKVVRLLSITNVFRDYIGYIKNPQNDPTIKYGQKNTTYLRVKSFSRLDSKYFVRFSVIENSGEKRIYNKIATITIDYTPMELTEEERDINPVGFQITGYRVDEDES